MEFEGYYCFLEMEKQMALLIITLTYIVSIDCFRNFSIEIVKTYFTCHYGMCLKLNKASFNNPVDVLRTLNLRPVSTGKLWRKASEMK